MQTDTSPLLDVSRLSVFYANLQVLWDVSFVVNEGAIVTLLGANGAGKTTLVQSNFGLLRERRGMVRFRGEEISQLPAYDVVKKGLSLVPEKRELFPKMTVRENLDRTAVPQYLTKGQQIYAEGQPEVRTFTRQDGTSGASLSLRVREVQLLGGRRDVEAGLSGGGEVTELVQFHGGILAKEFPRDPGRLAR